jgi:hypothetical protein
MVYQARPQIHSPSKPNQFYPFSLKHQFFTYFSSSIVRLPKTSGSGSSAFVEQM